MSQVLKKIALKPIREEKTDYDRILARIGVLFKRQLYGPLLREVKPDDAALKASTRSLIQAIQTGRISYEGDRFNGRFSAALSKELRSLGAIWDGAHGSFAIPRSKLPADLRLVIDSSFDRFKEVALRINKRLESLVPGEIAENLKIESVFDKTLFKVERKFQESVKGLIVPPQLTDHQRAFLAQEYTGNMKLKIQGFLEHEILDLRSRVQESITQGSRYENLAHVLETRFGVGQSRAKFIARQETNLFLSKFKQSRYQDAGVNEYIWRCVAGSPNHPVRQMHKKHDGQVFSFDSPPIVDEQGRRANPGEDFNCRCTAIPLVRI